MLITISQIIIFICIMFFIAFNLLSVYLYKESYSFEKIKILDPSITWNIITDIEFFKDWWQKFEKINDPFPHVTVIEDKYSTLFKISINCNHNDSKGEIWSFMLINPTDSNDFKLMIRKQSLPQSQFKDFMNKYLLNKRDVKKFVKNFRKEYKHISSALLQNS